MRAGDNGDHDWDWEEIHRRCLREARAWRHTREEIEDLAQDAVARAWRSRHTCRDPGPPTAWLRTIVRNEAHREHARHPERTVEVDADLEDGGAAASVELAQLRVDLDRAMRGLSCVERRLLLLRYDADLTQPDVARALDMPEGTAKVVLHRARKQLRARLTAYESEDEAPP